MKRHVCKKCGKKRWARTCNKGKECMTLRDLCKRCFTKRYGPKGPREPPQKRVKRKRPGGKPSGRKGRKANVSSRQK